MLVLNTLSYSLESHEKIPKSTTVLDPCYLQ